MTGAVMVFRDMGALRTLSNRMLYLAHHDSLTGLPCAAAGSPRARDIPGAPAPQADGGVVSRRDRFKHVNDSLGHVIGDRLLHSVAQPLLACVRRSDTVSRQGGDEFVILLSEISQAQDAAVSADKMLRSLAAPHRIDQHELRVTGSSGILVYPDDGADPGVCAG